MKKDVKTEIKRSVTKALEDKSDESDLGSDGRNETGDDSDAVDPVATVEQPEAIKGEVIRSAGASADPSPEDIFNQRIGVARQLALAEPDRAVEVLQRMIDEPEEAFEETAEETV